MFEKWKYRAKLAKLFRQKEKLRSAYDEKIRQAEKDGKPSDDIEVLKLDSYHGSIMIDEEIAILATDNLIRKVRRHFVPIPSRKTDGMWEQCIASNRYVLTDQGISKLRSALRKELNERYEIILKFSALLIGIIGALTGLVAVILK